MGATRNSRAAYKVSIPAPAKYRVVINWPGNGRPYDFSTSDKARARSIARRNAANGARVDFQVHDDWGVYHTTHTYGADHVTLTAPDIQHGGITRPQSWSLALPAKTKLINANDSIHFRRKAELVKVIRNAAWTMARHSNIPALQRAHIYFVIHPDTSIKRRDPGNWAPSAKAAVDGLVDAGILPDDNKDHLLGPDPRIGDPVKGSQLVLWITDLDQMHPDHIALLNPPTTLPGATT